ncbi:predicted protein, partial [Ostreococcus lucimarinus CCE9901]
LAIELVRDETPLDVVFENDEFLVVNKPPNLRFHPNHRFEGNSLLSRALHHMDGATPYIVHRLDMDTSGVAVFVKKQHLVANVAGQFQEKTAKKTYLAVSVGVVPPDCGDSFIVDAPIGDHGIVQEARTVDFSGEGKDARTTCEIIARATPPAAVAALVRVTPLTGRTHQIRVHLAHAGLPIVSDALYGPHLRWKPYDDWGGALSIRRQALHAFNLELKHPETGESLTFQAKMPSDMRSVCDAL